MGKFRKKPVVIEAEQLDDQAGTEGRRVVTNSRQLLAAFPEITAIGNLVDGKLECLGFNIRTLEGTMFAQPGDWIIRGVKGEVYPCKPEIFEATYDAVTEAEPA